ncbi:MAG: sulfite exporter TauE/SafE family protein [Dehalococcoidia bacterium]|nr:sulfite exporter TauE/SafE family protein [Dehalococcoidia bacterium]
MEWPVALAIILLAAIAACIQALSGFGFSLFIVPFLAVIIGPKDTVVLANFLSMTVNVIQFPRLRHSIERRTASILTVGSFAGMPVGLAVLLLVNPTALKVIIAVAVIVFTLLIMRGLRIHGAGTPGDLATGFASGILNTSTSMSGPPIVLYLTGQRLSPAFFRGTINAFFLATSIGAVALLLVSGSVKPWVVGAFLLAMPAAEAGRILGNRLFDRIDEARFRRLVYAILLLSATVALASAIPRG